jgi:hypothetical protein
VRGTSEHETAVGLDDFLDGTDAFVVTPPSCATIMTLPIATSRVSTRSGGAVSCWRSAVLSFIEGPADVEVFLVEFRVKASLEERGGAIKDRGVASGLD